ncbi:hypothetical protein HII31_04369 [Pseudocercospora fuligena]|uniref:Uncharacterized protein n=1 Tax=Pseudocercospora fuligena TaxID=685502 RepID=A0A8H6RNM7_9PEZI|nr:hypothetical protein HII31_04369 [Pseudocercospora fuligena]
MASEAMSPEAVVKQFYAREGAHNDKFRLNALVIPDGTFKGHTVLMVVANRPDVVTPKHPFRLMDVPPELRLRIYGYVLTLGEEGKEGRVTLDTYNWSPLGEKDTRQKCVTKGFKRSHNSPWHKDLMWAKQEAKWVGGEPSPFSLLLVNKQIDIEATPIAYSSNCFKIKSISVALSFAKTVGVNVKHLTTVHLRLGSLPLFEKTLKALSDANGLRTLYLSDIFILGELSRRAKHKDNAASWAEVLNSGTSIRSLLLAAQATYRAKALKWLALDIVQVGYERFCRPHVPTEVEEERQNREKLPDFIKAFRKLANEYLLEE